MLKVFKTKWFWRGLGMVMLKTMVLALICAVIAKLYPTVESIVWLICNLGAVFIGLTHEEPQMKGDG